MTNYEIVKKIIGQIKPVGNTEIDNERFENLSAMIDLIDLLIVELTGVASNDKANEYSIKRAGILADKYLLSLKDRL